MVMPESSIQVTSHHSLAPALHFFIHNSFCMGFFIHIRIIIFPLTEWKLCCIIHMVTRGMISEGQEYPLKLLAMRHSLGGDAHASCF